MLLHPGTYAEVPNQPCNPTLSIVNPFNSASKIDQLAQTEAPENQMYGTKLEVWIYSLFPAGKMSAKVRVSCVYNYLPWGIHQLTINELYTLWDVPLLMQEKLEELDQFSI